MSIKLFAAMSLTLILLFSIIFGLIGFAIYYFNLPIWFAIFFSIFLVGIQWLIGPKIIQSTTNMRYLKKSEYPWIFESVKEICKKYKIPVPKIAISRMNLPNAFVFGRTPSTATLVLTQGLINSLTKDEVKAVIGHELGHVKHKDMVVMTIVSAIPIIAYFIARSFLFAEGKNKGSAVLFGIGAFAIYFITNLLVLALSRLREYYADRFGATATKPSLLASALAKITYGLSISKERIENSAIRAFFIADPLTSVKEVSQFRKEYSNLILESKEIKKAMEWERKNPLIKFLEIFQTHPLTYKRILELKKLEK